MKPIKQNMDALSNISKDSPNKKLALIELTNAQKLKDFSLKDDVEIYSYIKDGLLFGFCTVAPSTEILWHYEFLDLYDLQELSILTIGSQFRRNLRTWQKQAAKLRKNNY